MSTQTQEHLGPYRLVRKIGEGGMGVVHLGLDGAGREVAIKVLHPHVAADLKARDRLVREVETMRRVRSPYVAEVIDAELVGGRPYVVTRFVPGRTLEDTVLTEGPLEAREVIRVAQGLCQALVAIHAAGVIHRDLKPSNVMLVDGQPLVIDFGIAHLVNATRLTQSGMFVGTPGYLAPEIIRNSQITQAADVHALASTLFFAATGLPPFGTGTFETVCFNIMEGRAQIDRAPVWLRGWLSRALQVDAVGRPSAQDLLRMAGALDPAGASGPPSGTQRLDERTLTMDTFSDLLPPVAYGRRHQEKPPPYVPAPVPAVAPTQLADQRVAGDPPPPPSTPPADPRRFLHSSRFVGVLLLVTLVALTVVMPVIVGTMAAALSLALRIGEYLFGENRRTLFQAVLVTVGHLLLALAFGILASSLMQGAGRMPAGHAESFAAGAFTLGLFVLPGSGAVRQAATRTLARVLPGRSATVVSVAVMGPIALLSLIVALGQGFA
ncbi:serine/threonine-protein kinase [Nonomuraea basaltis]|uniref:serine/threonine-protein kinase n=1 Tax=Nonomuraea basaltis TaxID=2495887 RepID=UPI00110C4B70|nr:serine/threonine-protein kinase [Nonomuraea basaltis]TMS00641.1 serine/threonine protein kinase [Nonomuraea basaltis]